jgi:hypothetical protein
MEIPGLGPVVKDDEFGWYTSAPRPVAALDGATVRINLDGFDDDPDQAGYLAIVNEFLQLDQSVLRPATMAVFDYYQDTMASVVADQDWDYYLEIPGPEHLWQHVVIGSDLYVQRDYADGRIYLEIACACDWEREHGLHIVIREGRIVSKVGPYDGQLTNRPASGEDLPDVVYRRINPPGSRTVR